MKNECHIVRDLMPLYTEGMLSNESAAFVQDASGDLRGLPRGIRRRGKAPCHRS